MSFQVTTAFVQQYKANVELLLQQLKSRFRGAVSVRSDYVGKAAVAVEQIGQVAATERVVRHGDVTPVNTPHERRWVQPRDYDVADLVDDQDKLRTLYDPTGFYASNFRAAHERKMDEIIIAAALGNNFTGENGTTATPFLAANVIAAGGTGLTVDKLRQARLRLRRAEALQMGDEMYIAVSAEEENDLFGEIQIVSGDFNSEKAVLHDGRIERFMGFNFIHSEQLLLNGAGERRIIAWVKSGLHLGLWKDVYTSVDKIPTKGATWQVYTCASYGATRTQELKVVEIACA